LYKNNRPLIEYLPNVLREVREFNLLTQAEEPELEELWSFLRGALDDQFIESLTDYGASRWEKLLKIVPEPTLERRRETIAARLRDRLPFTIRMLSELLTELLGAGNFEIELEAEKYLLRVLLLRVDDPNAKNAASLLRRVCPANLVGAVAHDAVIPGKVYCAGALLQTNYYTVSTSVNIPNA